MTVLALSLSTLAFFSPQSSADASAKDEPIPVLVVSGANNHDWRWTTPSLVRILEESGRFSVDLTYDPSKDLADAARVGRARAIVLDYNGPDWSSAAQANFLAAVESGTGVVVVHAADNSGRGWVEYEKLVADLWRQGTGHGSFHAFNVDVVDRDHPVTRSLPTLLMHPDELYHRLVNVHGVERRVLATAFSDPKTGGTGRAEPMILTRSYGKGRVFHTPLGHVWTNVPASQASHNDPQFRGLIVRGTEWAATGTVHDAETAPPPLAEAERAQGWTSLMNRDAWQAFGGSDTSDGWAFDGDTLVRSASAGDIVTRSLYEDFELEFQWKTTIAGNSGIKYRIPEDAKQAIGPEYQLLDPWSDVERAEHRAGAIYDVVDVAGESTFVPWGEYHSGRIVVRGTKLEHYLDGVLVASADTSTDAWKASIADSKFKDVAGFAASVPGRILLQDHGDEVWIRGMRVRRLTTADDAPMRSASLRSAPLFTSTDLSDWTNVGDATYDVEGDTLVGNAGPNRRQSFLVSKENYGDFVLEVDVKIAVLGNSGIQLRSHVNDKGRLQGYQSEIDPTDRKWSGGIFDEGRRGWLDDLSDSEAAREAFQLDGWNAYRIECIGPRIRTWVNGVPAANLLDGEDLDGSLGFQIHGGDDDIQIRWRNARLAPLGRHVWEARELPVGGSAFPISEHPGIRFRVEGDATELSFRRADGSMASVIPITAHKLWRAGSKNRVTVLRDGPRFVVQLFDRTAHDVVLEGVESVVVTSPEDSSKVDTSWVCHKADAR